MTKALLITATAFLAFASAAWGQTRDGGVPLPALTPRPEALPTPTSPLTLTVPADTEAAVTVLSGIHTLVSRVDDPVEARLMKPVYVNGRIALPSGTMLDGRITRIQPAGHLHRPAELAFRFERITLPDGQSAPISAVLSGLELPGLLKVRLDSEGYLKGTRGLPWKGMGVGAAGLGAFAGVKASIAGAATLGNALPAGGAALLAYAFVWPHGNEVNVPPDTRCRVRLSYPVTVRVPW